MKSISYKSKKQSTKSLIAFILGGFFVFSIALASTTIETSLDSAIQYIQKIVFTNNGGDTGTTGVIIDGAAGSIELIDGVAVNNIKTTMTTTDNTSLATTEAISGFVNSAVAGYSSDNFYTTGVDFNTSDGTLTILVTGASNPSVDLDGRYLTTYSETDPVFVAHAANGISAADISRRNSFDSSAEINAVESDPVYSASDASAVTTIKITNRDTAYGRGDHSTEGYLTSYSETDPKIATLNQDKRCFASGTQIFCTADEPVGGGDENLWNTGASDSINYTGGNVGIGTTTPSATLDIKGKSNIDALKVRGDNSTNSIMVVRGDPNDDNHQIIIGDIDSVSSDSHTVTINSGSTVFDNGNVGIGIANPTDELEVGGIGAGGVTLKLDTNNVDQPATLEFRDDNQLYMDMVSDANDGFRGIKTYQGAPIQFETSNTERMVIEAGGDVGIGITNPTEKLTVKGGNIQVQDTHPIALNLYTNASTEQDIGEISFLANNQGGSVELAKIHTEYTDNGNDVGDLVFSTSARGMGEKMRIQGDGKVGIGDPTPSYTLDVLGTIRAQGVDSDLRADDNIYAGDDMYADDYYYNSDIRYKENLKIIQSPLSKILALNGYTFDWKENGKHSIGVIAQELEPVFPELVTTKEDGYKSVKYGNLVAPIIEAIKEFYQEFIIQNTRHEEELELLHQEIELLKTEINLIKSSK